MKLAKLRPSASMIVACMALIAAIGGTSYAASTFDSGDIENRSLKGKDLANDTLGGKQIAERKLAEVPAAADADTLGGRTATDLKVRWLLLNEAGQIEEQSGGFTVLDAYQTNNNVYIDAGESVSGHGLTATIAIQNQVDVNGAPGADPSFSGEVSIARCQVPGVVECAPANSKVESAFVVSPRNSDGSATAAGSRKRVYVQITE